MNSIYKTQQDIQEQVDVILESFDRRPRSGKPLPYDSLSADMQIDSLDLMEIAIILEEPFHVELSEAFEENAPVYVTDITKIVCDSLSVSYQQPPRIVANSVKLGRVAQHQNQHAERE